MPLVNQIILKESDILQIVDQLRTTIPDEIKQARRVLQDKERILAQAQAEASALLARAREESEQAVNREGLLKAAEARSQEMLQRAEQQAEQLKNEADGYVVETLRALREHLSTIETDIGRSILSIEKGLSSLQQPTDEEDGGLADEDFEDDPESDPRILPRSASLAVDTMGGPVYLADEQDWDDPGAATLAGQPDPSSRRYDRS
jgi:hypothetical protein